MAWLRQLPPKRGRWVGCRSSLEICSAQLYGELTRGSWGLGRCDLSPWLLFFKTVASLCSAAADDRKHCNCKVLTLMPTLSPVRHHCLRAWGEWLCCFSPGTWQSVWLQDTHKVEEELALNGRVGWEQEESGLKAWAWLLASLYCLCKPSSSEAHHGIVIKKALCEGWDPTTQNKESLDYSVMTIINRWASGLCFTCSWMLKNFPRVDRDWDIAGFHFLLFFSMPAQNRATYRVAQFVQAFCCPFFFFFF